jgi:hypothetical protein
MLKHCCGHFIDKNLLYKILELQGANITEVRMDTIRLKCVRCKGVNITDTALCRFAPCP